MTMTPATLYALEERGLDVELATRMGWCSTHRADTDWLSIPCYRDGLVHRTKLRTLGADKRFMQEGEGPSCWNEDCLRDEALRSLPLIVTEGELDAMTAIQAGFPRSMSVPDGAPMAPAASGAEAKRYGWVHELRALLTLDRVPRVILATDGDGPGRALQHDLSVMLGRARCQFLTYPKGRDGERLKDLNDVLRTYGCKGVVETINRAAWVQTNGVYRMAELPELPEIVPRTAGFPLLDENYRLRLGDFVVVTGIPSHGKSAFVQDYVSRIVTRYGFRVAWASFEQEPTRDHRRALRCWHAERAAWALEPADLTAADKWIDDCHRFIVPAEDDDTSMDWMLDRMEQAVVQHGVKVIVIDPWNEMDHMRERDETETEYTGRSIKRLRRFARAMQIHLIVVAHPAKLRRGDDGKTPVPNLYDINGSAHWNNKADVGIIVHRENDQDTLIQVAKSRYHQSIGKPGKVRMRFDAAGLHYREIERV